MDFNTIVTYIQNHWSQALAILGVVWSAYQEVLIRVRNWK